MADVKKGGLKLGRKEMAVLSVIFGVLILIKPDILAILVGLYLLITGILTLVSE